MNTGKRIPATPAPQTICAICGAPLTDTTSSICPDCQELEKDW